MIKSYRYRIYPNKAQIEILNHQFDLCRWLHNTALEHRITSYKNIGKTVAYNEQQKELPEIKKLFPEYNNVHSQVLQNILKRLDDAFKLFFLRVKRGQKPGFPRFKGKSRLNSICYPQGGFKIIGNKVRLFKTGLVKIKLHRKIEGVIKTCSVKKSGDQWYVIFIVANATPIKEVQVSSIVGIDLGLESFAVLSNGGKIKNPRYLKKSEDRLKAIQTKYSINKGQITKRRLSKMHRKVTNQRRDFLHKESTLLIRKYDLIAYEDLNISNMIPGDFSKSITDAGWGLFVTMIKYKAKNAGTHVIAVNPRHTSQICSGCGEMVKKDIYQRRHVCPVCDLSIHRDLNASLNILRLGTSLRNSISKAAT